MNAPDIAARIEAYMRAQFQIDEADAGFTRRVDLFEAGYVDSVGVIETLAFVTGEFGVEIPDEVLLSDEFACIDGMARVIAGLRAAGSPPRATAVA